MKIDHIERAKKALREAIKETTGPVIYPYDDEVLDRAIHAIIQATISELVIEWRKGK